MANKVLAFHDSVFAAMMLQLDTQTAELQDIKFKLEQASKTLAQKDQIIGSLEQDSRAYDRSNG